jgi:hypothetical protein
VNLAKEFGIERMFVSLRMWLPVATVVVILLGGCSAEGGDGSDRAAAATGPTLSVSERTVRAGDVIELRVRAPRGYTWGVQTSLEELRDGERRTVYYWSTWVGKESRINQPVSAREEGVFPLIGFQGDASFRIRIPDVAPGQYRITKGFSSGPNGRQTIAEIEISVVS